MSDIFAVSDLFTDESIIFGHNCGRPYDEAQELVYVPRTEYPENSKCKCTYIEIDQVLKTHAIVLHKPTWMWGGEFGANEFDVVIGTAAVFTKLIGDDDKTKRLLGEDLLRLGLERAKTAEDAVTVITELLDRYGVGGSSIKNGDLFFHNSYLIADPSDIWVLECAGSVWVAKKKTEAGKVNISNCLSLEEDFDLCSEGMKHIAIAKDLYKPEERFNFTHVFDADQGRKHCRYKAGKRLLNVATKGVQDFNPKNLFDILRNVKSGLCVRKSKKYVTHGSLVSVLKKRDDEMLSIHFFTATADPSRSVFKPFIFATDIVFPDAVVSKLTDARGCALAMCRDKRKKRSRKDLTMDARDLEHDLYKLAYEIAENEDEEASAHRLFADAVDKEFNLYVYPPGLPIANLSDDLLEGLSDDCV